MAKKTVKQTAPQQEPTLAMLLQFLQELRDETRAGFQKVDQGFEKVDQRFEQVDQRFEQVDQRFEQVDRRFEQQDQRFLQQDQRFLQQDQRFQNLEALILRIEQEIRKDMNAGFETIKEQMRKDNREGGDYLKEMGDHFRKRVEALELEFPVLKNRFESFQRIILEKLEERGQALA
ncbi:MAG: hypothetical protein AAB354_11360 [candidate division KSB1 bacterium]